MKVVVAPDSLKESASAVEAADAICSGLLSVLPELTVVCSPISDGGEGFMEALGPAGEQGVRSLSVTGPDGEDVQATYRLTGTKAVIEVAQASGLHLSKRRNVNLATTFGAGELLKDALARGAREVLIGLGGSATVDGGIGLLRALGARFMTKTGEELQHPIELRDLADVALPTRTELGLEGVRLQVAVDVDQVLAGCARVFGPQKGGQPNEIEALEKGLERLAAVVDEDGRHAARPGSGAAGGLGFALSLLGADLRPGIDLVLDERRFDDILEGAALCVTAEGSIDGQSLQGKATVGVARRAQAAGVPCVAVAGLVDPTLDADRLPFDVLQLHEGPPRSFDEARRTVIADLRNAGMRLAERLR